MFASSLLDFFGCSGSCRASIDRSGGPYFDLVNGATCSCARLAGLVGAGCRGALTPDTSTGHARPNPSSPRPARALDVAAAVAVEAEREPANRSRVRAVGTARTTVALALALELVEPVALRRYGSTIERSTKGTSITPRPFRWPVGVRRVEGSEEGGGEGVSRRGEVVGRGPGESSINLLNFPSTLTRSLLTAQDNQACL